MEGLPNEALVQVAAYFQALAEPTRLQILNLLRGQERNVGELATLCGCSGANVSRHLTLLAHNGFVVREMRGNSAYYRIADPAIYSLCDLVCGNIAKQETQAAQRRAAFVFSATAPQTAPQTAPETAPRSGREPSAPRARTASRRNG